MNTEMNLRMLERAMLTILLGTGFTMVTGCGQRHQTAVPASVLAEVNGQPITGKAFRHWWQEHRPGPDTAECRAAVLGELIERSAQVQEARKAGLDQDPAVKEQIENILIRRLQETRLFPRVKAVEISSAEVQAYYESNLEAKFTLPEQSHLAVLWFDTRGEAPLVARYRARLKRARASVLGDPRSYPVQSGFGALAIQNSEHQPSRYQGGDVGWLEASTQPGFRATVERIGQQLTEPGETSQVVENGNGLFLVRLIERRPARTRELASVFEQIRQKLLREKKQQVEEEFQTGITRAAAVRRFADRLAALPDLTSARTASIAATQRGRFDPPMTKVSQPRD